jgi:hypothetical protein
MIGPPESKGETTQRRRRLSAALRENLKRRKEQAKGRSSSKAELHREKPHDSAGIADDK